MNKDMDAFIIKKFGDYNVLEKDRVEIPSDLKDDELLIKVFSSSYNPSDKKVREGKFKKITPINNYRIIGFDFSGRIIKKGKNVLGYHINDEVFGYQSIKSNGSYAKYLKTKSKNICLAPTSIAIENSGTLSVSGTAAYKCFKNLDFTDDKTILINGVSGGVGTFLLQMIKNKSPNTKVIGTASKRSYDILDKLGIDSIIDYKKKDIYTSLNTKYDVVINLVELDSNKINRLINLINIKGKLISTTSSPSEKLVSQKNINFKSIFANPNTIILKSLQEMVDENKLRPIISQKYKFNDIKKVHQKEDEYPSNGKTLIKY